MVLLDYNVVCVSSVLPDCNVVCKSRVLPDCNVVYVMHGTARL